MSYKRLKKDLPVVGEHHVTIVRQGVRAVIARKLDQPRSDVPRQTRITTVDLKYAPLIDTGKNYRELKRQARLSRWDRLKEAMARLVGDDSDQPVRVGA